MDPAPEATPHLVLIGTGHVFQIREAVRQAIQAKAPAVVFVELDRGRFNALMHRERTGQSPPAKGFIHGRLQRFQENVAGMYGAEVGGEMIAAVEGAQDVGARLALIDMPGDQTVKRAVSELTWREKGRAAGQVVKGAFQRLLPRKDGQGDLEQEIRRYQDDPGAALGQLREQFPTVYRVVIDERDEYMAQRILHGLKPGETGVAVVGDGHVEGMQRRLKDLDLEVYRLPDVRAGRLPKPEGAEATGDGTDVSYGFHLDV